MSIDIKAVLADHALWLRCDGGKQADLSGMDLSGTDMRRASLKWAILIGTNMHGANLIGTDLSGAKLIRTDMRGTNMRGTDLSWAKLIGADLRCLGNMRELRTMQIDTWDIGYTADTLQIGCQRHPIDKWRKWNTDAGRKWIAQMDSTALAWADRNLDLVLGIIDANPATPTGHEVAA